MTEIFYINRKNYSQWVLKFVPILRVRTTFNYVHFFFFKKILEDISFFVDLLILLFWTSGDISSDKYSKPEWAAYLHLLHVYVLHVP